MIEINLLPDELKKKEPRFKKIDLSGFDFKNLPVLKIVLFLAAGVLILQIILLLAGIYGRMSLAALTKRYDGITVAKKEAGLLKSRADVINKKAKAIDALMGRSFSWAKKLNVLSNSVTPGIWLSEISYDERRGSKKTPSLKYLYISGYAASMGEEGAALVGKFIKSLKENGDFYSDFSDIELGSIKSDMVEGQEVMRFKITCLFKD